MPDAQISCAVTDASQNRPATQANRFPVVADFMKLATYIGNAITGSLPVLPVA